MKTKKQFTVGSAISMVIRAAMAILVLIVAFPLGAAVALASKDLARVDFVFMVYDMCDFVWSGRRDRILLTESYSDEL
jgi:hypothetical protein